MSQINSVQTVGGIWWRMLLRLIMSARWRKPLLITLITMNSVLAEWWLGTIIVFGERFAEAVAEVLLGNEIGVYMLPQGTPTPVTAFMIKHLQAAGAVMLTASHNPPSIMGSSLFPVRGASLRSR